MCFNLLTDRFVNHHGILLNMTMNQSQIILLCQSLSKSIGSFSGGLFSQRQTHNSAGSKIETVHEIEFVAEFWVRQVWKNPPDFRL